MYGAVDEQVVSPPFQGGVFCGFDSHQRHQLKTHTASYFINMLREPDVVGSSPTFPTKGEIAQVVERRYFENVSCLSRHRLMVGRKTLILTIGVRTSVT